MLNWLICCFNLLLSFCFCFICGVFHAVSMFFLLMFLVNSHFNSVDNDMQDQNPDIGGSNNNDNEDDNNNNSNTNNDQSYVEEKLEEEESDEDDEDNE